MHLIAGVDPGTTVGIAVLDLDGNLIKLHSSKNWGLDKTVDYLVSLGKVSILASDVNPAPDMVQKIASSLGAKIYVPRESLHVNEKIALTREFRTRDAHQRDALAAALTAHKNVRNKLGKISSMGMGEKIKHLVLQGLPIKSANRKLQAAKGVVGKKKSEPSATPAKKPLKDPSSERRLKSLEAMVSELETLIKSKDREIENLRALLMNANNEYRKDIRRDREITSRDKIISDLQYKLKEARCSRPNPDELASLLKDLMAGKFIPLGLFPEEIEGLTVMKYPLKKSDVRGLPNLRLVFTDSQKNKKMLSERGIAVADTSFIKEIAGCFFISAKQMEKVQKSSLKISLEDFVTEYRRKRNGS